MAWNWTDLCGSNFTVWTHSDFGRCFEQLAISCMAHVILLLASVYHIGHQQSGPWPGWHVWTLHLRLLVAALLALAPVFTLALTPVQHLSLMDVVSSGIKIAAWVSHCGFIYRHYRFYHLHIRGPVAIVVSVMLTTFAMVIQLRSIVRLVLQHGVHLNVVEEYVTYLSSVLHVLYLCTLVPSRRPSHVNSLNIQTVDGSSETSALLPSDDPLVELGIAEDGANCLSRLTFWWVQPLMIKGSRGQLHTTDDIFQLPKKLSTADIEKKFGSVLWGGGRNVVTNPAQGESSAQLPNVRIAGGNHDNSIWDEEGGRSASPSDIRPSSMTLMSALNKTFGLEYYGLGILKLLADLLGFGGPLLLNLLVNYMEDSTEPLWHGYLYAGGLFLSTFLSAMLSTHFDYQVGIVGFKVRAAIITVVYHKAMTVNSVSLGSFSSGEVVNFMSTDTDRIVNFCPSFHQFWSLPFQVAISLWLLHQQVGLAFMAGVGFAILLIPVNRWLAVKIGQLSTMMMHQKDNRVKVMNEILYGIRVIKFYAWEGHFTQHVDELRQMELQSLKGRKYLDAMCVYFWATTPVLISILTFMTYSLMGNKLTAAKVFTSLALFNMLISPLNAFPWVINGLMEAWVSVKRLQNFLLLDDLNWMEYYSLGTGLLPSDAEVVIRGGGFSWCLPGGKSGSTGTAESGARVYASLTQVETSGDTAGHASMIGQPGDCTEIQPSMVDQPGDSTEIQPSMVDQPGGSTATQPSEAGQLGGSTATQPSEAGQPGGSTATQPSEAGQPGGSTATQPSEAGQPGGTTHTQPSEAGQTDGSRAPQTLGIETCQMGNNCQPACSTNNEASRTQKLTEINISIKKGHLVGVVGAVGTGKSSLLSAILAEMCRESGHVMVADLSEGFGLASQEPWIQHATLRDNILFGSHMDEGKYRQVLDACALTQDLKVLPKGDMTEIGENGVTLSGGQKARVALARAVYQDKPVYLLDDPLAAVDAHVAQHLFSQCIMGLLRDKTRILCTHHTKYLVDANLVIVLKDGKIAQTGPPSSVLSSLDLDLPGTERHEPHQGSGQENKLDEFFHPPDVTTEGSLVQEEEKESGTIRLHVYKSYWQAVGACLSPLILVFLFLMQASRNVNDWWLSYWVSHTHDNGSYHGNQSQVMSQYYTLAGHHDHRTFLAELGVRDGDDVKYYLTVYAILAAANSVFTFVRAFLFAYGGICAATLLHKRLLSSILKAPISFFDITPIGRIINRFSSDLYSVDDSLPFTLNILLAQFYAVLGTVAITCYGLPWFAVLLMPLGAVYFFIQCYYRVTSRELKRISSISLSPIYAHFSESVTGLVTIRALRHSRRFCVENRIRLEANQKAQYCSKVAAQWLNIRLQMIGVAMVTGIAFIAVLEHHFQSVNPGLVGLAISYALSVTNLLGSVLLFFTETEKMMVNVERIDQYIHEVPQEKDNAVLSVPPFWPIQGTITFQQVCLRYRRGLPYALCNVCLETQPAEKVGIVGRTGSGKSSLFLALFQMVEVESGQILIDGINVRHLDLHQLRSRLAIIPQDPFLFSGTVRANLDPMVCYTDRDLWAVLQRCHLKTAVSRLGGLDAEVAERGRHFSVGQRQLLCLARALLTRAKVLCIDEATASVDQQTDTLIQETLRKEFKNHTVLTIAHRIHTVLDSDRVLVMNAGKVAEFEQPQVLLANPNSLFYSLVRGKRLVQS